MKAICLGGAGKITREAALDLVQFSDFSKITIADINESEGQQVAQWLNDDRVNYIRIDIHNRDEAVDILKDYDIVLDGTTISLNALSTACIAEAGCHGINLNGFGEEYQYNAQFREKNRICIPGFGMTPGTWPPANMQLLRALYDWGFMKNQPISVNGNEIGIMDAISRYLIHSEKGRKTELYGYALHVEIIGKKGKDTFKYILTHTHPASDGSVEDWEGLRAYTRCVGIPFSIAAQLIAKGRVQGTGVIIPERALNPSDVFEALEKQQIDIHTHVETVT